MTKRPMTVREMASLGGKACANSRTPEERQRVARNAVQTRWARYRTGTPAPMPMNRPPLMDEDDVRAQAVAGLRAELLHLRKLLAFVRDAGRPHSHLCECERCNAWLAVEKELEK